MHQGWGFLRIYKSSPPPQQFTHKSKLYYITKLNPVIYEKYNIMESDINIEQYKDKLTSRNKSDLFMLIK